MATVNEALLKLSKSKFRSSFHLSEKDKDYVNEKGLYKIREHATDIITSRLAPAYIPNDGKQTPTKGHPVFIAQHACALCCRGCMNKWYKVKKGVPLTSTQIEKCVNLLMAWIEKELL
jgi:exodeoxyribonuclease V alpha subunit